MTDELTPTIIQDANSKEVYMLGCINTQALEKTKKTGYVHFFSRKRQRLWMKGETSGNKLKVREIMVDCDNDTFLILVELEGKVVCHTGNRSCFFKTI